MYEAEAAVIRRMVHGACRIVYSRHARDRMAERGITDGDVRLVLGRCRVTEVREGEFGAVHSAEGTDIDGRPLRVCVAVREPPVNAVVVVTAIDL